MPGYTYQCALKYTDVKIQIFQDKDTILLLENNIRGGIRSVLGDRYVVSNDNKTIIYIDAKIFFMVIQGLKCYLMMKMIYGMVSLIFV